MPVSRQSQLRTNAPVLGDVPPSIPTGNLWVSLPEISMDDGAVLALGVLHERSAGLLQAQGREPDRRLIQPMLAVGGEVIHVRDLNWTRQGCWLPHFEANLRSGTLEGWYCAPIDERGVVLRLRYRHTLDEAKSIEVGWEGWWEATTLAHLRAEQVSGYRVGRSDAWTGSRVVTATAGLPLLAVAWQAGDGAELLPANAEPRWRATKVADVEVGEEVTVDLYVGVGPETDGAATTALHLRRRGFDALWDSTLAWLLDHTLSLSGDNPELRDCINKHLFFNYFFAQGDCIDTGTAVTVTSRSPRYYVCGAFWSRDAYCWTFPGMLLTDTRRARQMLVASMRLCGPRLADHALYINGTSLYPGFELDQAAAPVIAVWRYIASTGDWQVLEEHDVAAVLAGLTTRIAPWRHAEWELYATFLLPTDDPTDFPYVTSCNALLAVSLEVLARLVRQAPAHGVNVEPSALGGLAAADLEALADGIRQALRKHLVVDSEIGPIWAWGCDADGTTELRDEPPLSLRLLPYLGLGEAEDPVQAATTTWLRTKYRHHYGGHFPGSGSDHFPYPSGFDLANRLLDGDQEDGDPLRQLVGTPMDQGLGCESWDPETGQVRTGAAMASMSGLLAWAAATHLSGRRRLVDHQMS
ncbi:MAG: glycoside hydrolase family 125 protein [Acidimicrobiales bacterium]